MYNELKEMLEQFSSIDITQTPNFRAMVLLRDELVRLETEDDDKWFTPSFAGSIAARAEIDLSGLDDLDQVEGLVIPFAGLIYKLATAMIDQGFSNDAVLAMTDNMKLKLA